MISKAKKTVLVSSLGVALSVGCGSGGDPIAPASTESVASPIAAASARPYAPLSLGDTHSCALGMNGDVYCWGLNTGGQLGAGPGATNPSYNVGQKVAGLGGPATVVAANANHTCAVRGDGQVWCWGSNASGELGDGTTTDRSSPVRAGTLANASTVSAGLAHSCAVLSSAGVGTGNVVCWGTNGSGQLGDGTTTSHTSPAYVPLTSVVAVALGDKHSCALRSDGTVWCWGANGAGQLGDGTTTNRSSPTQVSGVASAKAIAAMASSTCALLWDGSVKCWGQNGNGQLGNNSTLSSSTPVSVHDSAGTAFLTDVAAIGAGAGHACAVMANGTVKCWGKNGSGQLGNGTTAASTLLPTDVSGISDATTVDGGAQHTCITRANLVVSCFGSNASGQLGNSVVTSSTTPVTASPNAYVRSQLLLTAGTLQACAVASKYISARCWGANHYGQLGDETTTDRYAPVNAGPGSKVTSLVSGDLHTCVTLVDGTAQCWGNNSSSELGDGTTTNSASPVTVNGLSGAIAIANGEQHTCALISDGTVKCWGDNEYGQLGDGHTVLAQSTPVPVYGLSNAIAIALGGYFSCALTSDGAVTCWGSNFHGQLGDGTTSDRVTPTAVSGVSNAIAIAAGFEFACALLSDGTARCWGSNFDGQLGNGTTTDSSLPVTVSGISDALAITTGFNHACVALSDGSAKCWGENETGKLGDGTTTSPRTTPVTASGFSNVIRVAAGGDYTCAIQATGEIKCVGSNYFGQLGIGAITPPSLTPVAVSGF